MCRKRAETCRVCPHTLLALPRIPEPCGCVGLRGDGCVGTDPAHFPGARPVVVVATRPPENPRRLPPGSFRLCCYTPDCPSLPEPEKSEKERASRTPRSPRAPSRSNGACVAHQPEASRPQGPGIPGTRVRLCEYVRLCVCRPRYPHTHTHTYGCSRSVPAPPSSPGNAKRPMSCPESAHGA